MKKVLIFICIILCINLTGCKRYEFTERRYISNEEVKALSIEELDTPIIIEFGFDETNGIDIEYYESQQETYSFEMDNGLLKIKKSDSSKGMGFYLSGNDEAYEDLVLKIRISKEYLDKLDINAKESSIQIIGGNINELYIQTTYDPIDLDHVAIGKKLTGITKYDSIKATIIGNPADFSVKSVAEEGMNNLKDHSFEGTKMIDLRTEDGDIDVTFTEE